MGVLSSERSQVIFIFVFFLLLLTVILGGALAVMWTAESKARRIQRESLRAFYLAQAGIERAKIWARHNPGGPFPHNSGWIALGQGQYRFIVEDLGGLNRRLESHGQTLDVSHTSIAERQIAVEITGIENPFVNPADDDEVPWSWQEI
ncbi:MAG: hypothetical protein B5M48_01670 [Candidatus Omnitrophica bacterium 4484_213]|nr:MAG: hypothetical protein B5M48_01670 [Candidatus Omnitrophica bacterium 4484_213]